MRLNEFENINSNFDSIFVFISSIFLTYLPIITLSNFAYYCNLTNKSSQLQKILQHINYQQNISKIHELRKKYLNRFGSICSHRRYSSYTQLKDIKKDMEVDDVKEALSSNSSFKSLCVNYDKLDSYSDDEDYENGCPQEEGILFKQTNEKMHSILDLFSFIGDIIRKYGHGASMIGMDDLCKILDNERITDVTSDLLKGKQLENDYNKKISYYLLIIFYEYFFSKFEYDIYGSGYYHSAMHYSNSNDDRHYNIAIIFYVISKSINDNRPLCIELDWTGYD
eukprot:176145_1